MHPDLLGNLLRALLECDYGRAVRTRRVPPLAALVAVLALGISECLPELLIGPYDAEVPVDHQHIAGDPLEEQVVLPLPAPRFGQFRGHLDHVPHLGFRVPQRRQVHYVVAGAAMAVHAGLVRHAHTPVIEGGLRLTARAFQG